MTSMKPAPTPLPTPPSSPENPSAPKRPRRSADLFDAEGNPVHITLTCLCCRELKPLASFGLRKMSNGSIRNQPWCRSCRSSKSSAARAAAKGKLPEPEGT